MLKTAKRRYARAPIRVPATCTLEQRRVDGTLWQIGEGGFFVELPEVESLPDTIAIGFELPGSGAHRAVAHPVWKTKTPTRGAPDASRGAGCEFKDIAAKTRVAVAAYVKKMKETYSSLQFALALDRPTPQLPLLLRETGLDRIRDQRALKERVASVVAQLQPRN